MIDLSVLQVAPIEKNHLIDRIPWVVALARSGKAKIQYFQLLYPFDYARAQRGRR